MELGSPSLTPVVTLSRVYRAKAWPRSRDAQRPEISSVQLRRTTAKPFGATRGSWFAVDGKAMLRLVHPEFPAAG